MAVAQLRQCGCAAPPRPLHAAGVLPEVVSKYIKSAYRCAAGMQPRPRFARTGDQLVHASQLSNRGL